MLILNIETLKSECRKSDRTFHKGLTSEGSSEKGANFDSLLKSKAICNKKLK